MVECNDGVRELVKKGAEARIYLTELFGQPCVCKERFIKNYRVPVLDQKLTKNRIL